MRPWMQPLYDAVEMIMELDRQSKARFLPADLMDSSDIAIEPLSYIRGRSIPRQFMIIDESQNLTPLEVKTIITRVGHGTKIVLTGDVYQIDNPYVDKQSNGFAYLINRFASEPIAAHVTLTKGERSELAELAANIL
jgi:PhoH-like ATPase